MEARLYLAALILLVSNFYYAQSVYLGGTVYLDKNDSGFQEPGELSLGESGRTVTLSLFTDSGNLVATTNSDAEGRYIFETVPGIYYVEFIPPASIPLSSTITRNMDDDVDGDDNGIQMDTDGDGYTDGQIISPRITLSIGAEPTNEPDGPWGSTVDANFNGTIDFGLMEWVGIGGLVFVDYNDNGIFDPGEDSLGEKGLVTTMELYNTNDSLLHTTQTNPNGQYIFNTITGDYYVSFLPPTGYPRSSSNSNTADDNVSFDDNGMQQDTDGDGITDGVITSPVINLQAGDEPTFEFSNVNFFADENADTTIDFGLLKATTSVSDYSEQIITIHPNPVTDYLSVVSTLKINHMEILSADGRLVRTERITTKGSELKIQLETLQAGFYLIRAKNNTGVTTLPFQKM